MAQIVEWLTASQVRYPLGALPVLYTLLETLQIRQIINRHCPTQADVDHGKVAIMLVLNRLMLPLPLYQITDWVGQTVLVAVLGVPAGKFNDDRHATARLPFTSKTRTLVLLCQQWHNRQTSQQHSAAALHHRPAAHAQHRSTPAATVCFAKSTSIDRRPMATATPPAPGSRTLNLLLRELTGARMLAISPRLVRALDSANAAVFLTYLLQVAPHAADDAGWFVAAKTRIEQETGLPDVCQDAALAQLTAASIVETGGPQGAAWHINLDQLLLHLEAAALPAPDPPADPPPIASAPTYDQRWALIQDADLLAIDELEKYNATDWAARQFLELIDYRWRHIESRLTLLAMNSDWFKHLDPALRDRCQDGRARIVAVSGSSYRPAMHWSDEA